MLASSFPSYPMRSHCIPNVLGVNPRRAKSEVIEYLVKMGVIVICAGGGGIPTTYRPGDSLIAAETVIDKDRADALLARELKADVYFEAAYLVTARSPGIAFERLKHRRLRPREPAVARFQRLSSRLSV